MRIHRGPGIDATILGAASLLALAMGNGNGTGAVEGSDRFEMTAQPAAATDGAVATALIGDWISSDGTVRLDLRADGRYDRSIVGRDSATSGSYRVKGLTVLLRDDSGLRTTVDVIDGVLEMAGHHLYRT